MASNSSNSGPSKTTDLDTIWNDLKAGIEQVYLQKTQNMTKNRYIELYT